MNDCLKEEFTLESSVLGFGRDDDRRGKFLGREITLHDWGVSFEGDAKHVNVLLDEWDMKNCKSVSSPGSGDEKEFEEDKVLLKGLDSTKYRRAAARLNYMALDRPELSYASKEIARGMANPSEGDVIRLKRVLRFLKGCKRSRINFVWQDPVDTVTGMSDSDWAGCLKTRRSSSGGTVFMGKHLIHHYSNTQSTVAL